MSQLSEIELPNGVDYGIRAGAIPFGIVDDTSTSTAFTATVQGITELTDGTCMLLKNGVVTSASGFTVDINGLGAKPVYSNMAAATRDTTMFNINYTMLFVYDETRVSDGCWICYRGYNSDNNTIGYQLRTNSTVMNVSDTARYYKLYFTSADNTMWIPASANSTNSATSAKAVNQRPINPFGRIVYTSATTSYAAGANLAATTIWTQYSLTLGYSFNRTGAALTLTVEAPVYVKCAPQADGSAIIDADTPIVQALPNTEDGKIYIYLGVATSATAIELYLAHPVYYYKDGAIRLWTNAENDAQSAVYDLGAITPDPSNYIFFITEQQASDISDLWSSGMCMLTMTVGGESYYAIKEDTISYGGVQLMGFVGAEAHLDSFGSPKTGTILVGISAEAQMGLFAKIENINESDVQTIIGSTVPSWAMASTKPSYTASEVGAQPAIVTATASLPTSGWSNKTCTASVAGVTASNNVIVSPAPASYSAYASAGIYCSAQGAGTLTFTCDTVPTTAITVNVMIM